jgi:hypothetical protein
LLYLTEEAVEDLVVEGQLDVVEDIDVEVCCDGHTLVGCYYAADTR